MKLHSEHLPVGHLLHQQFETEEVLSVNADYVLYRACDRQSGRHVMIREYLPAALVTRNADWTLSLRDEAARALFQSRLVSFVQEARLLANFSHPALQPVSAFWLANGTAYVCSPWQEGMTLATFRQHHAGQITESWLRKFLPPLLGALEMLHEAGYLCRHIAPEFLLVKDNRFPVILHLDASWLSTAAEGDAPQPFSRYRAPEYANPALGQTGPWSDIYSLGALLRYLLTGSAPPPHDLPAPADIHPAGFSAGLCAAVNQALARRPADRPQSMRDFARLCDLPVQRQTASAQAKPENAPLPVRTTYPTRVALRRWRPALMGAIVALLALYGGYQFWHARQAPPAAPMLTRQAEPVAQVYIRRAAGETVRLNGKPIGGDGENDLLAVQLPPGRYTFSVGTAEHQRQQTLEIRQKGLWLLTL